MHCSDVLVPRIQPVEDLDCAPTSQEDAVGGIHSLKAFKKILKAGRA